MYTPLLERVTPDEMEALSATGSDRREITDYLRDHALGIIENIVLRLPEPRVYVFMAPHLPEVREQEDWEHTTTQLIESLSAQGFSVISGEDLLALVCLCPALQDLPYQAPLWPLLAEHGVITEAYVPTSLRRADIFKKILETALQHKVRIHLWSFKVDHVPVASHS